MRRSPIEPAGPSASLSDGLAERAQAGDEPVQIRVLTPHLHHRVAVLHEPVQLRVQVRLDHLHVRHQGLGHEGVELRVAGLELRRTRSCIEHVGQRRQPVERRRDAGVVLVTRRGYRGQGGGPPRAGPTTIAPAWQRMPVCTCGHLGPSGLSHRYNMAHAYRWANHVDMREHGVTGHGTGRSARRNRRRQAHGRTRETGHHRHPRTGRA